MARRRKRHNKRERASKGAVTQPVTAPITAPVAASIPTSITTPNVEFSVYPDHGVLPNSIRLSRPDGDLVVRVHPSLQDTVRAPSCVRVDPPSPPVSAYKTVRCALHDGAQPGDLLHVEECALYAPYRHTDLDTEDSEQSLLEALTGASPELQALFPSLPRRGVAQRPLLDTFYSSAIPCTLFAAQGSGEIYDAIFPVSAHVQHSCAPNARFRWDAVAQVLELVAIQPIGLDEEITVSYLPRPLLLVSSRERRQWLRDLGVHCACSSCVNSTGSDADRAVLAALNTELALALLDYVMWDYPRRPPSTPARNLDKLATKIALRCVAEKLHPRLVYPIPSLPDKLARELHACDQPARAHHWRAVAAADCAAFGIDAGGDWVPAATVSRRPPVADCYDLTIDIASASASPTPSRSPTPEPPQLIDDDLMAQPAARNKKKRKKRCWTHTPRRVPQRWIQYL
ncbi:hypothetical protein EXIGLDRAFT_755142 [Exidia glandulosa HHB12029]|uniref:SET domain-containing protein n=1 Tax=Exidia glandulosa HHB12029 TaxID=1314781 RepID=A0A165CB49_EXIGL|nr:hypothetical protein EXIGLDRAFT_755142 [Exidia glandulosa HHB12029]